MRVCPICKIKIIIPDNTPFATPAVAALHDNGTYCKNVSSHAYIKCANRHPLKITLNRACNGCKSIEKISIQAHVLFRTLNGYPIEYGSKDQFIHVKGITYNLYEIHVDEYIFVKKLMIAQRLHPPQINKEMQTWLLCSKRMGIHKDIRLLICRYLKMYPHYIPPPPPPPLKIPWMDGIVVIGNIAGKMINPGLYALYSVLLLLYSCRWMDILAFLAIHTKFWMVGIAWFILGYPNRSIYINAIFFVFSLWGLRSLF
jgi:hypothetical protein